MATSAFVSGKTVTAAIECFEGIERLEPEWQNLWNADPDATPFHSPQWLIPWTRFLWGGGQLRVVTLRHEGRLVALAPFFLWGFGNRPETIRLSFLGSGITDYLGMISVREFADEAAEAIVQWLVDSRAEWDVCDLQELRTGSALVRTAAQRLSIQPTQCNICPVVGLRDSFADQVAGLESKFRRNLRTAEKRLAAAGNLEFVRADAANLDQLLGRLFELHTGRWEERGLPGMFSSEALRNFHAEVARRFFRSGMLRLFGLLVNGECAAVQYNFAAKGRVYAYLSGFDRALARSSPGAVLLARSVEEAIEEGAREFDFLRHAEDFKHGWGATEHANQRLLISRSALERAVHPSRPEV